MSKIFNYMLCIFVVLFNEFECCVWFFIYEMLIFRFVLVLVSMGGFNCGMFVVGIVKVIMFLIYFIVFMFYCC